MGKYGDPCPAQPGTFKRTFYFNVPKIPVLVGFAGKVSVTTVLYFEFVTDCKLISVFSRDIIPYKFLSRTKLNNYYPARRLILMYQNKITIKKQVFY